MPMHNPSHPGRLVRDACLDPLGLTVTEGARILGVSRPALSNVINGRSSLTPEMAIRLSKAFGSTPRAWLRMQWAYDLARAEERADEIKLERYRPVDPGTRQDPPGVGPEG